LLSPANLPEQFKTIKDKDEEFLWIGEPNFPAFLTTGVPFLIFGLLWGAFDFAFIFGIMNASKSGASVNNAAPLFFIIPFFALHLFPFWASILNILRLVLVHKNTFYAITDKRVMMRSGFLGIDFNAIDLDNISDMQVTVNPIENLLKVGTIRFSTGILSKGSKVGSEFIAVKNPYEVFKKLKTISLDVKTDWNYPNKLRPEVNPGYNTKYEAKD